MTPLRGSALMLALVLAGCSQAASTASPSSPPSSNSPPNPSTPAGASTSPRPSVSVAALPVPAACGRANQELDAQQAGACYLAIVDPVNLRLPILVQAVQVNEPDPEHVRETARDAVAALSASSAALLGRRWPAAVAGPVRQLGERQQAIADAARPLAADTTPAQVLKDREQLIAARGDTEAYRDLGIRIRAALGLPPIQ